MAKTGALEGIGDGSVKPIRTSIDEVTLGRLACRNDGEVITGDF